MTNDEALKGIDLALAQLTLVRAGLMAPPARVVINVLAGGNLRSVLELAPAGALVRCEMGVYEGPFVLTKPVTVTSTAAPHEGRATIASPVWLISNEETVTIKGPDITLAGIGVRSTNNAFQLINIPVGAERTVLDQVTAIGDPVKGQRRGIRPEGADVKILRSYIDHIGLVGAETQGIGASLGGSDILVDDTYVCAAAEALMVGGSDTPTAERIPRGWRVTRSTLTKRPEWYAAPFGWQIKNALELKCCLNFSMSDCTLQYAGISEGQGAYLILFTPKNQDGAAPWSTVQNVLIERCHGSFGGGCVSFMGSDYNKPSGPLKNVVLRNVYFDNIDPKQVWKGDARGFFFNRAPQQVVLENITVSARNMAAMFYGGPLDMPPTGLVLRNLIIPTSTYGMKIDSGGQGQAAWQKWAPDCVMDRLGTADATGATGYPA